MNQHKPEFIRVWDPLVRIGHWTLVTCFFIAYFTEDDLLSLHVWAGYVLAAVVLFRLLWGFIGSRHARFGDFIYSPARVKAYLKSLRKGPVAHYVGHNPAGGWMIILLLLMLSGTVYT
ncbi:MAG: cytochrome b/b6 domain-containing protein, partial [Lysobacterales bacterium]